MSLNSERTIAGEEAIKKKKMGRRVHLLFAHQRIEYGSTECRIYDDQEKKSFIKALLN